MIPRIRVFAGPNGSGKSTLAEWLSKDYSVNLYQYINADQMFSEIDRTLMLACPLPMDNESLLAYTNNSTFPDKHKAYYASGNIQIKDDFVIFTRDAVNPILSPCSLISSVLSFWQTASVFPVKPCFPIHPRSNS